MASPRPHSRPFPADTPKTPSVRRQTRARCDTEAFADQVVSEDPEDESQDGVPHWDYCNELQGGQLPHDSDWRDAFDKDECFVLGDPGADVGNDKQHTYAITGEAGFPIWEDIFCHILHSCGYLVNYDTVYVLVDTRPLHLHDQQDPTLPHWPAAVAWWESRLQMRGPRNERTELLFFQACKATGLHNVHPTWAGTFVLAALGAVFPGIHFILLDSDCLPVTLFEAADLWKESYLTRFPSGSEEGLATCHPLQKLERFQRDQTVIFTQGEASIENVGQGVLLVTEPHSEVNAGFVVMFASDHRNLINWKRWNEQLASQAEGERPALCRLKSEEVTALFWDLMATYLNRKYLMDELPDSDKKCWLQTGLALSPLVGTVTQYSVEVILAWALVGEWTSRILFPVPQGQWPRHAHGKHILEPYHCRSPKLTAWARACFEQGALPSLLYLPGIVPVFSLPGDRMYQATHVHENLQRPVILHAYGGAKTAMEAGLGLIKKEGWITLASAMVGAANCTPAWAADTWTLRPVPGTSLDLRLQPVGLTIQEELLLLGQWHRTRDQVPSSALCTWLCNVNKELGPDCTGSPHVPTSTLKQESQDAVVPYSTSPHTDFPSLQEFGLESLLEVSALEPSERRLTFGLALMQVALTSQMDILKEVVAALLRGTAPSEFPVEQWKQLVQAALTEESQWPLDSHHELQVATTVLQHCEDTNVLITTCQGQEVWNPYYPSVQLRRPLEKEDFPLLVKFLNPHRGWPTFPDTVRIDATGLGGRDLLPPREAEIVIRSDQHGQNIYGPSMCTVEALQPSHLRGFAGEVKVTALGASKACHEFLWLHYVATDSAPQWNLMMGKLLPSVPLPSAGVRRADALRMLRTVHIAPSHRRDPHHIWKDALRLILDLLLGHGKDRYLGRLKLRQQRTEVQMRGYSAGSYVGVVILSFLQEMSCITSSSILGAIACPPELLYGIANDEHQVHLVHYGADKLCVWHPETAQLRALGCTFTYVHGNVELYPKFFGQFEHDYCHWMDLPLTEGELDLAQLLYIHPAAATEQERDAAPLRLISWLTFSLPWDLQNCIDELMDLYTGPIRPTQEKLMTVASRTLKNCPELLSHDSIRNYIVQKMGEWNEQWQPAGLFRLFSNFLTRISLPRLIYFLDMVLPQLVPMHTRWDDATKSLLRCHLFRLERDDREDVDAHVTCTVQYLFTSWADTFMIAMYWAKPLLLFSDTENVGLEAMAHFQSAEHGTPNKRRVQMGLPDGHSVLLYYQARGTRYQVILLSMSALPRRKAKQDNAMWRHVWPKFTTFAWLSQCTAEAFNMEALARDHTREYGNFAEPHLGLEQDFAAPIHIEDVFYLGETRSIEDLTVLTRMPAERLCMGCGIRSDEVFCPILPGERANLFQAANRLLRLLLDDRGLELTAEETYLQTILRPLARCEDGHLIATVSALLLSLVEGKTDCPISGVFGAGKTRAAAATIAGLITVDPSLRIMVLTKENVASQAFAEHILRLELPPSVEALFGRLVGYMALHNGTTRETKLDIPSASRHDVIRSKRVIIGCGGGFRHECACKYGPMQEWMAEVDVALQHKSQQFGNLDEASAIARMPRKCLIMWLGDHRQTPGGLRKSEAARRFRQKLLKRPVALRGDTELFQPNQLSKVVSRYLTGTTAAPAYPVLQLLLANAQQDLEDRTRMLAQELLGMSQEWMIGSVFRAALAILWLSQHQSDVDPMFAVTLEEAAGLSGRQKWSLVLPSSARVSEVTYEAVIGVRYPELDNWEQGTLKFGSYLRAGQSTVGGFLPIFWQVPLSSIQACSMLGLAVEWIQEQFQEHFQFKADENSCLAVLHNRNDMVSSFHRSEWVSGSKGGVVSRGITSCAGMTARMVLLSQTKIGFLTGGRSKLYRSLSVETQETQKEEAYARATVALTRAQQWCFIMCPLDMKGLIGAATVIGSLQHGCGVCESFEDGPPLLMALRERALCQSQQDTQFLRHLHASAIIKAGQFPPAALAQIYIDKSTEMAKLRRLHLIIVDLHHPRRSATRAYQHQYQQMCRARPRPGSNTTPMPLEGGAEWRCRYAYGYSLDGADIPVYFVMPDRTAFGSFYLLDCTSNEPFDLRDTPSIEPIGIDHFYESFGLQLEREHKRNLISAASTSFGLELQHIAEDLSIPDEIAAGFSPFTCGPRGDRRASKKARTEGSVAPSQNQDTSSETTVTVDSSVSASESESSVGASNCDSVLEALDVWYTKLQPLGEELHHEELPDDPVDRKSYFDQKWDFAFTQEVARELRLLPDAWPLARLTFPLASILKQMELLLQAYCFETVATSRDPEWHEGRAVTFAEDLTQSVALHIAETIADLLQQAMKDDASGLVDSKNAPLLCPKFWLQPVYTELLNAGSRFRAIRAKEVRRPATSLVKVMCIPYEGSAAASHRGKRKVDNSRVNFLGDKCWAGSLLVWFPASWMPSVVKALRAKNANAQTYQDTVVPYASGVPPRIEFKLRRWHADKSGQTPILHGSSNVTWFTLFPGHFIHLFSTLYFGLLDDVYYHKLVTAWESAAPTRVQVSLLLPSWEPAEEWLHSVRVARHLWPLQMSDAGELPKMSARRCMDRVRKRLRTRRVWESLGLNWAVMKEWLFTRGPTGRNRQQMYNDLFGTARQGSLRWQEAVYRGPGAAHLQQNWERTKEYYVGLQQGGGPAMLDLTDVFRYFEDQDDAIQKELEELQELKVHMWRTKQGVYRKKTLPDVRDGRET